MSARRRPISMTAGRTLPSTQAVSFGSPVSHDVHFFFFELRVDSNLIDSLEAPFRWPW